MQQAHAEQIADAWLIGEDLPHRGNERKIPKGLNMGSAMVSESQLAFLRSIDTPTVCNLIEIVTPERRGAGYTASHLQCPFPHLQRRNLS